MSKPLIGTYESDLTTLTEPDIVIGGSGRGPGAGSGGGRKNPPPMGPPGGGGGGEGPDDFDPYESPQDVRGIYRIGIWFTLGAVFMLFSSLVVTYLFLASSEKWSPLQIPITLWFSTGVILTSSLTFELARRALRRFKARSHVRWLAGTLGLGTLFIALQLVAWWQLAEQGAYLTGNPHSSLFYILTGAHALHLIGGFIALLVLLLRAWRAPLELFEPRRRWATEAAALYWHFLDGLWVALFVMLLIW